ncbi:MAG: hypothetical protein ACRC5C_08090 [Bacilli bacterium]
MTTEVCIMNCDGIALAADSAVTIGNGKKVYNTANKLFSLSKFHPVGIMIYNHALFISVPWETIIKEYRKQLGRTKYATVYNYYEHFLQYFTSFVNSGVFTPNDFHTYEFTSIVHCYWQIKDHYVELLRTAKEDEKDEVFFARFQKELKRTVLRLPYLKGFDDTDFLELRQKHYDQFMEELVDDDVFDRELHSFVTEMAIEMCVRKGSLDGTGLVIAGFGDREFLPSMVSFNVVGMINGKLIMKDLLEDRITLNRKAIIKPFAQTHEIMNIIKGIEPKTYDYIVNYLKRSREQIIRPELAQILSSESIEPMQKQRIMELFDGVFSDYIYDFTSRIEQYIQAENIRPLFDVLNTLPKEELAEMAEALVSITSFKKKISRQVETVGGPVDVAVITKGDGFIWIKRKRYFSESINRHYYEKYLGDDEVEKNDPNTENIGRK